VVPLSGAPARRAAKAMGIGQGSSGPSVQVTQQFYGDNWRDGGIADDLMEKIHDGLSSLIRRGRRPQLALGTV
jgi:hypothetical protein